jgi:hypothetical protein
VPIPETGVFLCPRGDFRVYTKSKNPSRRRHGQPQGTENLIGYADPKDKTRMYPTQWYFDLFGGPDSSPPPPKAKKERDS